MAHAVISFCMSTDELLPLFLTVSLLVYDDLPACHLSVVFSHVALHHCPYIIDSLLSLFQCVSAQNSLDVLFFLVLKSQGYVIVKDWQLKRLLSTFSLVFVLHTLYWQIGSFLCSQFFFCITTPYITSILMHMMEQRQYF